MILASGRISWRVILFVVLLVISGGFATDSMAYGYAGEKGVWYRRWIKRDFLAWDEIAFVAWFPSVLTLYPKHTTLLRANIGFPIASLPWQAIAQMWGRATPQIVECLHSKQSWGPGFPRCARHYAWKAT
jgi:hypothetical protein